MACVVGGEELRFCRERLLDDLVTDDISTISRCENAVEEYCTMRRLDIYHIQV